MIARYFRKFDNEWVRGNRRVVDVLKELNDRYPDYRTEGIVYHSSGVVGNSHYEIFYSYVEDFTCGDPETEDIEETDED